MEHVDSTISVPKDCLIVDRSKRQILDLAYTMKWARIRDVTLHPLSGPAPLIHWRVLVALVAEDGFFIIRKRGAVQVTGQVEAYP